MQQTGPPLTPPPPPPALGCPAGGGADRGACDLGPQGWLWPRTEWPLAVLGDESHSARSRVARGSTLVGMETEDKMAGWPHEDDGGLGGAAAGKTWDPSVPAGWS